MLIIGVIFFIEGVLLTPSTDVFGVFTAGAIGQLVIVCRSGAARVIVASGGEIYITVGPKCIRDDDNCGCCGTGFT